MKLMVPTHCGRISPVLDVARKIVDMGTQVLTGALPKTPEIPGLEGQYAFPALELLEGKKEVRGPRVLVIGAGRVGLEVAEKLGKEGFEVVATKRTDPVGGMMEMITYTAVHTGYRLAQSH